MARGAIGGPRPGRVALSGPITQCRPSSCSNFLQNSVSGQPTSLLSYFNSMTSMGGCTSSTHVDYSLAIPSHQPWGEYGIAKRRLTVMSPITQRWFNLPRLRILWSNHLSTSPKLSALSSNAPTNSAALATVAPSKILWSALQLSVSCSLFTTFSTP